jgi:hypothetical protein
MRDHERAMLAYARLAALSDEKRQLPGRDKFLVLTGAAACHAGWPDVAARCRDLVLLHNPAHLLSRFDTFAAALRSGELDLVLKRLQRMCSYEHAEHLLAELEIEPALPSGKPNLSTGTFVLELLAQFQ